MEQVEKICEQIVLINKGENILEGGVKEIKEQFKDNLFRIDFEGSLPSNLNERVRIVNQKDESVTVQLEENQDSNELLRHLLSSGLHVHAFNEILPTLNEIFIKKVETSNEVVA